MAAPFITTKSTALPRPWSDVPGAALVGSGATERADFMSTNSLAPAFPTVVFLPQQPNLPFQAAHR